MLLYLSLFFKSINNDVQDSNKGVACYKVKARCFASRCHVNDNRLKMYL